MPHNGEPVLVRVGLHSGSCTSGLLGSKPPKFTVFGDTMNTVSACVWDPHLPCWRPGPNPCAVGGCALLPF